MQLALRACLPPALDGHDGLLVLLVANGAVGWLAASGGDAGIKAEWLRAALTLGLGGAIALIAVGALRGLAGGLLASPIGGLALLALLLAAWQARQQRQVVSSVAER
jgi:hypothetical protein